MVTTIVGLELRISKVAQLAGAGVLAGAGTVAWDGIIAIIATMQRMPALSQSARASGWLVVSAASTVEATTKALNKAKIEAIVFIASVLFSKIQI
jgi:hypothetical protein